MQLPCELSLRNVARSRALDLLLQKNVTKLEKICDHIKSCRIAVEKPQQQQSNINPYRVQIDIAIPPFHEIVVSQEPRDNDMHDNLYTVVQNAFDETQSQIKALMTKQSS